MPTASLHIHKRKRAHNKRLEKYPPKDPHIKILDNIVGVIAIIYPLMTIPQIIKIFVEKSAAGVSLVTWIMYLVLIGPLIVYSRVHKDNRLTWMWSLWGLVYLAVVIGAIMYS